jgi:hypothetical protein
MNGQYLMVGQAFVFSNGVYTDMADIFVLEWLDGDVDWKDKQHGIATKKGKSRPEAWPEEKRGSYTFAKDRSIGAACYMRHEKENEI